jgi:hypothetical protein
MHAFLVGLVVELIDEDVLDLVPARGECELTRHGELVEAYVPLGRFRESSAAQARTAAAAAANAAASSTSAAASAQHLVPLSDAS